MAKLNVLNKDASKIMEKILAYIPEGETAVKIANNDVYMPLCVERDVWDVNDVLAIMPFEEKFAVSLCHYGECNGDAMRDPEVVFICYKSDGAWKYVPATFQNDWLGVYERDILVEDGRIAFKAGSQRGLKDFCNQWLENIAIQQDIVA